MERTITIGDVEFDIAIFTEPFACDLAQCRGACCTIPNCYGAPLEEHELPIIERVLPQILPLLSERARRIIRERGIAEQTPSGEWVTMTVDSRECVFAFIEHDVAFCAFHRAWQMGVIEFPKPLSCHLFPLRRRAGRFYYERYPECNAAIEHGRQAGSRVYDVARPALQRLFGDEMVYATDAVMLSVTETEERCQN